MELRIDIAPNCSLSPAGARRFMASIGLLSLPLSLVWALRGFWPVLVYWALEMVALAMALRVSMDRRFQSETVWVTESQVGLVTRSRRGETHEVFARHWARVRLQDARSVQGRSRLTIESGGRRMEIGRFLTEEERRRLAARLRTMVGGMNESPPLEVNSTVGDPSR
jgi:uncharacterized membrane protein